MESVTFYDQWKLTAPEDETDPPWGACARCRKDGHLYQSPKQHEEVCNACLTIELKGREK